MIQQVLTVNCVQWSSHSAVRKPDVVLELVSNSFKMAVNGCGDVICQSNSSIGLPPRVVIAQLGVTTMTRNATCDLKLGLAHCYNSFHFV